MEPGLWVVIALCSCWFFFMLGIWMGRAQGRSQVWGECVELLRQNHERYAKLWEGAKRGD